MALVMALGFTSCSSDDDSSSIDCQGAIAAAEDAFDAYFADQSVENCNALKAALQAALDGGCAEDEEEAAEVQATIDGLNCEGSSGDCVTCAAYEIAGQSIPAIEVCEGANGNAFVQGVDTTQPFAAFIASQETFTTCE